METFAKDLLEEAAA